MRRAAALAAAMGLCVLAPAAHAADTRYAEPGGSNLSGCAIDDPCEVHRAVNNAGPGDEVIILAGDYGSAVAPLVGSVASAQPNLNVHGEDGKPRPRIFLDTGDDTSGFMLSGAGSKARHLEVHHHASLGSRQTAFTLQNAQATDIVARNTSPQGRGCAVLGDSLLTDSVCEATAPTGNTKGIATYTGVGPGAPNNSVLRNVTAIATSFGSMGIEALSSNTPGEDQNITVTNAIARGCSGCADVAANNTGMMSGNAVITIDHSNFGFEGHLPVGSSDRVVDGPGGGNQRFIAVNFLAPGDFHQAAGSPTIDNGATDPLNGAFDFDGDPRALGQGGTDIGADEFVPPPTAVTGAASSVTTSAASLNGTVNPNTVATTYHFEYGPTPAYATSTPAVDPGAGGADVAASAAVGGLAANSTYHFRVVATSRGGTTNGADATFTTQAPGAGGGPLLSLAVRPSRFAAAARGRSVRPAGRRRRTPIGTRVSVQLSEAAAVSFAVQRPRPGRRVRGRCVKPTARNRRARRCTRYVRVRGGFSRAGSVGVNRFRFTGRLRGRKLALGRYRLVATAQGPNGPSRRTALFRIVRRRATG